MSYQDPPDFTSFDVLTAAEMDILAANDRSFHDGTGLDNGILTNAMLSTASGELGGASATWAPTWTNLTVGNGTVAARKRTIGKKTEFTIYLLWGSTTSVGGSVSVSLPVTSIAVNGQGAIIGNTKFNDGSNSWLGPLVHGSTTTCILRWSQVQGTGIKEANISSTAPSTWTTGSQFFISGSIEAA